MLTVKLSSMQNQTPRALRNNNPCNIRKGSHWFGLRKNQTDESFCQFDSMVYGFRAFFKLCNTYVCKYHICTVRGFVSRFAPVTENNVRAYCDILSSVLRRHHFSPSFLPPFGDSDWWIMFALAVAYVETGKESVVSTLVLSASGAYCMVFGSADKLF